MDRDAFGEGIREQVVLDHLRRHLDQRDGMAVVAAVIPGHVEHADHAPARVADRDRRAGEEAVGLEEVFSAIDADRRAFDQRGADGIGAATVFGPGDTRLQGDPLRALQKIGVAQRMQNQSLLVGQHHHAVGAGQLLIERFEHRQRVGDEVVVLLQLLAQEVAAQRAEVRLVGEVKAVGAAAIPGFLDGLRLRQLRLAERRVPCIGGRDAGTVSLSHDCVPSGALPLDFLRICWPRAECPEM